MHRDLSPLFQEDHQGGIPSSLAGYVIPSRPMSRMDTHSVYAVPTPIAKHSTESINKIPMCTVPHGNCYEYFSLITHIITYGIISMLILNNRRLRNLISCCYLFMDCSTEVTCCISVNLIM